MGQRRRFTPEFKRQAVLLLNAGQRPAAEIAREERKRCQATFPLTPDGLPRARLP
jgi:transposase-like protein